MGYKDRSRNLARDRFWDQHEKSRYECPECGRGIDDTDAQVEVHHKNGDPFDNSEGNLVGLCRLCHQLREGKKPDIRLIRELRDQYEEMTVSVTPSAYFFVHSKTREPVDPPWVNPFELYWSLYQDYLQENPCLEEGNVTDLMNAFEMLDGVEIERKDDGIEVYGRELDH